MVRYTKDVLEPERLAGKSGEIRELDEHYAAHLVQERCAVIVDPVPERMADEAPARKSPAAEKAVRRARENSMKPH